MAKAAATPGTAPGAKLAAGGQVMSEKMSTNRSGMSKGNLGARGTAKGVAGAKGGAGAKA